MMRFEPQLHCYHVGPGRRDAHGQRKCVLEESPSASKSASPASSKAASTPPSSSNTHSSSQSYERHRHNSAYDSESSEEPKQPTHDPAGPCVVCGRGDDEGTVRVCELCNAPYHCTCHSPPMQDTYTEGDWICSKCTAASKAARRFVK